MGTISKMSEMCKVCPDRDKCNHKKMELCAYIDEPKAAVSSAIPNGINISFANVGGIASVSMKEIEKSINKRLSVNCGW